MIIFILLQKFKICGAFCSKTVKTCSFYILYFVCRPYTLLFHQIQLLHKVANKNVIIIICLKVVEQGERSDWPQW